MCFCVAVPLKANTLTNAQLYKKKNVYRLKKIHSDKCLIFLNKLAFEHGVFINYLIFHLYVNKYVNNLH